MHFKRLVALLALASSAAMAATNEFTGAAADWQTDGNWSLGRVPTEGDDVLIDGRSVTATNAVSVRSLTLAGAAKLTVRAQEIPTNEYDAVFRDDATALDALRQRANVVTIAGDFTVGGTAVVRPEAAELTGVPVVFRVGGDFTLAAGASFDAVKRGWGWSGGAWEARPSAFCKPCKKEGQPIQANGWTLAIGAGLSYGTGGNYGRSSAGTEWQGRVYSKSYGPSFAPLFPGSPAGLYVGTSNARGPGSIVVLALGAARIDGVMDANGTKSTRKDLSRDDSGPSGGGIWLAAKTFAFGANAALTAEGGDSAANIYGPGKGGRIALSEGCDAAELDELYAGRLPRGAVEATAIEGVAASVVGGLRPDGTAGGSGSLSHVRSRRLQTYVNVRTAVEGLVTEGDVFGTKVVTVGEPTAFEAPAYGYDPAHLETVRWPIVGYVVSNCTAEVARGETRRYELTALPDGGPYTLTWLLGRKQYSCAVSFIGNGAGSVSDGTVASSADFLAWGTEGGAVTLTATAETGSVFAEFRSSLLADGYSPERTVVLPVTYRGAARVLFEAGRLKRVYTGGAAGDLADPGSWLPRGVPDENEEAIFSNAVRSITTPLRVAKLTISGGAIAFGDKTDRKGFSLEVVDALTVTDGAKVTFYARELDGLSPFANRATATHAIWTNASVVTVGGAFTVSGGATVVPANAPVSGTPVVFRVGSFELAADGTIDATALGWTWADLAVGTAFPPGVTPKTGMRVNAAGKNCEAYSLAFGVGSSYGTGAGHGGNGRGSSSNAYGFRAAPFLPGSPSGCNGNWKAGAGGGSVCVLSSGAARVDGTIKADGELYAGCSGSSGGGIWIAAESFAFGPNAAFSSVGGNSAKSGNVNVYSPGAGGRISVASGLSAEQLEALAGGAEPEGVTVRAGLPVAAANVAGGVQPEGCSGKGGAGTLTTVGGADAAVYTVAGSPVATDDVQPAVGSYSCAVGETVRFTAEEYGRDLACAAVRYACRGYVVSNATGEVKSGTGRSVDVTVADGPVTVTWLWGEPRYGVVLHKPAHGTLTRDGARVAGDLAVWPDGATPSLGVEADEGWAFAGWEGNLPQEAALSNPFALTPTEGLEATPRLVRLVAIGGLPYVARLGGAGRDFETPLAVSPLPEAFGVELASAADGAVVTVGFVDAQKNAFSVAVPVTGTSALFPVDAAWAQPVKVTSVRVRAGEATLKSLRGVYAEALPHAEPYFASLESLTQPLVGGTTVTASGTRVDIPETGLRLVLHKSQYNSINFVWDDGTTLSRGVNAGGGLSLKWANDGALGLASGETFTISDATVNFVLVGTQYVRPQVGYYQSGGALTDIGLAYAADCEQLPKATEHVVDLMVTPNDGGGARVALDGSYVSVVRNANNAQSRLTGAYLTLYAGAEYALKEPPPAYDEGRWTVLDLAANPRAKAFKDAALAAPLEEGWLFRGERPVKLAEPLDSADVSIAHYAHKHGGYSDVYMSREPSYGFGGAVHYRVPARDYVRAHLVVALDTDAAKEKVLYVRFFGHANGTSGDCGANLVVDTKLDWTDGPGAGAEQIGLVQRGEELIPLYAVTVPLDLHKLVPEAARNTAIDVEFLGPKESASSLFPDPAGRSAFNLFGVTLEAAPVTLDIVQDGCTGNVFTQDEADRRILLRMKAIRATSGATVSWTARTRAGEAVFSGSGDTGALARGATKDIAIDLSGVADPDLYLLDLAVSCEDGAFAYSYPTRFAIVPPSGRAVATEVSPYTTWWNSNSHGTTGDWNVIGPLLKKAGIRKVQTAQTWDPEALARYGVTSAGNCTAPAMSNFDAASGRFLDRDGMTGEQWFVKYVQDQIDAKPHVDHILVWHESAPSSAIPEEILGLPVPEATDADRRAGAYVNEIGRLVRKHFPNLRIQIGNSTASLGAACLPFRGGADPQYYDSMGIEIPSQTMMPERLLVQSIQGMMMTKEAASYYAKRPIRACGCYEYTYRTTAVGEELQAAYYMRDTLISLANEMPVISPGIIVDAKDYYYQDLYGSCGMAYRTPWCEPKLAYVAYAALTKALDGVTLLEELPTGSTTVYALSFRRCDGRYATAIWTARGEATLAFTGAASGDRMGFLGKVTPFDGTAVASELPSYVITDTRLTAARIAQRGFRKAATAASRSISVCRLADAAALTVQPDARIKSKAHGCLPMMTPSEHFSVRTALDRERGRCIEVALDTAAEQVNRYYTEYTTLRFAEPAEVPAAATAIGVWTKGNSSWGQIRFELTDADGDVFVNYDHPSGNYDPCDWQGLLCVNFDGWAYVSCKMPNNGGLAYDAETGLRNAPWYCETRGKGANGKYDGPGRLTAITVGVNREKLDLVDFKPTDARVRLADVRVEGAGLPGPEPETSIDVWEGGATGDWSDPAGWSLGRVPDETDDVLVEGATLTATNGIAVGTLALENAKLTVRAPELTDYSVFETVDKATAALRENALVVRIAGDFIVSGTSVVQPEAAELSGVPVIFRVGGDVTVDVGAAFDVNRRGWGWSPDLYANAPTPFARKRKRESAYTADYWTVAFGAGENYSTGGNYRYGTSFAPFLPGSPSGAYYSKATDPDPDLGRGPGSIVVLADGTMTIRGKMLASPTNTSDGGTPSGGAIWLAAQRFIFGPDALLTANGGSPTNGNQFGPGQGGRIALAEGCTDEEIDEMLNGTLPESLLEGSDIAGVAVSVAGGNTPNGAKKQADGTIAMVRPKSKQAILTVGSDAAGLVAEGVTFGDVTLTNGVYEMTAPEQAFLASDDGVRYDCAGYVVSNATGEVTRGTDRTARFAIDGTEGPYSLTWRWTNRRVRVVVSLAGEGSVTLNGEAFATNFVAWVPSGETQAFVALSADGWNFSGWSGSALPAGVSPADPALDVALTASATLDASFSSGATTRLWTGPKGGLWTDSGNWDPAGVPSSLDDVYLTNATVTVAGPVSVAKMVVAGSSKITFNAVPLAGESTAESIYAGATVVRVTGGMEIGGTSVLTVANDLVTGAAVKFDVGSFFLAEGARVTADSKGWFWYTPKDGLERRSAGDYGTRAMGAGNSYTVGGGHGALGGNGSATGAGASYGEKYAPFLPGSPNGLHQDKIGNGSPGGGTVWIRVRGLCRLDGAVTADVDVSKTYGSASGGSVWIAADGLAVGPFARLSAHGGAKDNTSYGSEGAGGRISVALGVSDEDLDALARGETPAGLAYADQIGIIPADVTGGISKGQKPVYGKAGTATTVTGPNAWQNVTVAGDPVAARGVEPDYGVGAYEPESEQTFTAPERGLDPSDPAVRYACTGWVLSNAAGEVDRGEGTTAKVKVTAEPQTLTWLWGAKDSRIVIRKPEHGKLLLDGVQQDGDAVQWTTGAMLPVTVVPDAGYEFLCWEGKMPLGKAAENPISFDVPGPVDLKPVLRLAEGSTTRTWNGTGVWTDASKWTPKGNIPGPGDDVVIAGGVCSVSNYLAVKSLAVTGGKLQVGAQGDVNAELAVAGDVTLSGGATTLGRVKTMTGHAVLSAGGDLRLSNAATLTVCGGPIEGEFTFASGASSVTVGGTFALGGTSAFYPESDYLTGGSVKTVAKAFELGATATVNASERGWRWIDGNTPPDAPGLGYSYNVAGSYGGVGGGNSAGSAYGQKLAPIHPGSPNGNYSNGYKPAGGLVRIHARTMRIDGSVTADANASQGFGGASGGGIWLTADSFAFGAESKLSARGGGCSSAYGSNGGGGRIAVGWKLSEERLAELAETGTFAGLKAKRIGDRAAFCAAFNLPEEAVDVSSPRVGTQADHPGSFVFLNGRQPGFLIQIR